MTFTPKDWRNLPDQSTPINALALENLEGRLAGYTDSSVAALRSTIQSGLDLKLTDYVGVDSGGGSDMATIIDTAAVAASAAAIAGGYDHANLVFPKGKYRIDTPLRFRNRVRFLLDEATIFAGADMLGSSGMIQCSGLSTFSPVAQGSGDTVTNDFVIRNLSNPELWNDSMVATGTGIPAHAHVLLVDQNKKYMVIDKACTATGTTTVTRDTYFYGQFVNCGIIGGILDPNQKYINTHIRPAWTQGFVLDHTIFLHNRRPDLKDCNWAMAFSAAMDCFIDQIQVIGGEAVYEDGCHISGTRIHVVSPYIESGDDCIAIGEEPTNAGVSTVLPGSRHITVVNPICKSNRGFAVKIYANGTVGGISDVTITGLTGRAGVYRNGGIYITNDEATATGASRVRRIHIDGQLEVGSLAYDASSGGTDGSLQGITTPADPSGASAVVTINKSDDVRIDVKFTVEMPLTPVYPFYTAYQLTNSENVVLGPRAADLTVLHGAFAYSGGLYAITDCPRFFVEPEGRPGAPSRITRFVETVDDFTGISLDTSKWQTKLGTGGGTAGILANSGRGILELQTGNNVGADMANNGSQVHGAMVWHRENGSGAEGLAMDTVARVTGATLLHCVFIGYTDQNAVLEMPFTYTGGTLTATATDAFGFLLDSQAPNTHWWAVAVNNNVITANIDCGVDSGYAASTHDRLSLYGQTSGKITYTINGNRRAVSALGALNSVLMCPVAAVFSRGANIRFLDIDKIYCRMQRGTS